MEISITVKMRLELISLINSACRGKKKDPKRRQGREVLAKINFDEDELKLYQVEVPGAGTIQLKQAIKKADATAVSLTKEDARFLEALMADNFTNLGPEDDDWLDPLEEVLASVT